MRKEEFKIVEDGIVPVYETDTGEKVVYGRELHEALEVKSSYRDWSRNRLADIDAVEGEDYEGAKILAPSGQAQKEHIIKLDIAKEMAMLERNEKGRQVRRYFIQLEKKFTAVQKAVTEQTMKLQKHMKLQNELIQSILIRVESLERKPAKKISVNPFNPQSGILNERMKKLDVMVVEIARLRSMSKDKILHLLYVTIEENNQISLDAYKSVYISESGDRDASTLKALVSYDRIYEIAVDMCIEVIERCTLFG